MPLSVTLENIPWNSTLRQVYIRLEGTLTEYDVFQVTKRSVISDDYNFPIIKYIPTIDESYESMWQEINIDFLIGEYLQLLYANVDDLDIFFEALFTEAD